MKKDIIIISVTSWYTKIGSNAKNIAIELSKEHNVVFINYPETIADYIKQLINNLRGLKNIKRKRIDWINDNLLIKNSKKRVLPISGIKNEWLFRLLNRYNSKIFSNCINSHIKEFNLKNTILINDSSMYLGLHFKKYLKEVFHAYYIRDNLSKSKFKFWQHAKYIEPEIIMKADVVLTNSTYYQDYALQKNQNSFMVGQGCDLSLYNLDSISKNILNKRKKVGYVGNISSLRLDIDLIVYLAENLPEIDFVFVGPLDKKINTKKIQLLSNVIFKGKIPEEDVPKVINDFDICINPQVVNDVTVGNYPRKIDEYLAMGKPVIATKTLAMEYFKDSVILADSYQEYKEGIIDILSNEDNHQFSEKRRKIALNHSWENCVSLMMSYINKFKLLNTYRI